MLRSSSTPEPSDPLCSVVFQIRRALRLPLYVKQRLLIVSHPTTWGSTVQPTNTGEGTLAEDFGSLHPLAGHRRAKGGGSPRRCRTRCGRSSQTSGRAQRQLENRTPRTQLCSAAADVKCSHHSLYNDPSAGSPTETLLRLLLPLNAQVWLTFQLSGARAPQNSRSKSLTKTFNR